MIDKALEETTFESVLEDELEIAKDLGIAETAFAPGRPLRAVLSVTATLFSKGYNALALPALKSRFFGRAKGAWLTLLAWTDRDTPRGGAEFAGGEATIENRGGGFFTIAAGDLRIQNASGKTFTNTSGGALAPWLGSGAYPTLDLTWSADESGTASNTPAGGIKAHPTPLVSGPANVYCQTNASAWLGADEEPDDQLERRAVIAPSKASPGGPRLKYESVALETKRPDGKARVNINRVRILEPGNAVVRVLLASPAGAASGDASTVGTDVYEVNARIQSMVVPPGITATVESAVDHPVNLGNIILFVATESTTTRDAATTLAQAALEAWAKALPIGGRRKVAGGQGYVYTDEATAVAKSAVPGCFLAECASANTAIAADEVAVISWSLVVFIVKQG